MPLLFVGAIASIVLIIFANGLAKRHRTNLYIAIAPWLIAAAWIIVSIICALGFVSAFNAMETAAPDQRAAMLARGIAESLNSVLIGSIFNGIMFVYLVVVAILSRKAHTPGPTSDESAKK